VFTSPSGKEYQVTPDLDRDGVSCYCEKRSKICGIILRRISDDDLGTWGCRMTVTRTKGRYYTVDKYVGPLSQDQCKRYNKPVDGGWGRWSHWSSCSKTCGSGRKSRIRDCNSPAPAHGGKKCSGDAKESQTCEDRPCKIIVDGAWGRWSHWSSCSKTCGSGRQTRVRDCNSPAPANGGKKCYGDAKESQTCEDRPCRIKVDGQWGSWGSWSSCTKTCGPGSRSRTRRCDSPAPANGGNKCRGDRSQSGGCSNSPCQRELQTVTCPGRSIANRVCLSPPVSRCEITCWDGRLKIASCEGKGTASIVSTTVNRYGNTVVTVKCGKAWENSIPEFRNCFPFC